MLHRIPNFLIGAGLVLAITILAFARGGELPGIGRDNEDMRGPTDMTPTAGEGIVGISPRAHHAMANRVNPYVYGGRDDDGLLDDTWKSYDPEDPWYLWENVGPPVRESSPMVFDTTRGLLTLFGGMGESGPLDDTWIHTGGPIGTDWEHIADGGPSARYGHDLAFDPIEDWVILFGGTTDGVDRLSDTWLMRYNNGIPEWVRFAINGIPARSHFAMVYDTFALQIILFGGSDANGAPLGDTWTWTRQDGWVQIASTGPSPRYGHTLVFDTVCGVPLLFGGTDGTDVYQDTWVWVNGDWIQLADDGPDPRMHHAMTHDSGAGLSYLYGGMDANCALFGDTWAFALFCPVQAFDADDEWRKRKGDRPKKASRKKTNTRKKATRKKGLTRINENQGEPDGEAGDRRRKATKKKKSGAHYAPTNLGFEGWWSRQAPATARTTCRADVDASGYVDRTDMMAVLRRYGRTNDAADVDENGRVGASDLMSVLNAWGVCR